MTDRPTAAVLGMGLIGASLSLGLKQGGRYAAVLGWDPDFDVARRAQRLNAAGRFTRTAQEAARGAAAVFVAVPQGLLQETLTAIAPHAQPGAIVCGLVEGQERALELASAALPAHVSFVAAHPVLWETVQDGTAPSPELLRNGMLCVAPSPAAHPDAVGHVAGVAESLGMEARFLDAREHDAFFGGVSQLPAVLAALLLRVATAQASWRELGRLAGGDFRWATALVEAEPDRRQDALVANREHLVRWLDALGTELADLRTLLQDGQEPAGLFGEAAEARRRWLKEREQPAALAGTEPATPPSVRKRLFF
jgi:prephenate dehydrogenase